MINFQCPHSAPTWMRASSTSGWSPRRHRETRPDRRRRRDHQAPPWRSSAGTTAWWANCWCRWARPWLSARRWPRWAGTRRQARRGENNGDTDGRSSRRRLRPHRPPTPTGARNQHRSAAGCVSPVARRTRATLGSTSDRRRHGAAGRRDITTTSNTPRRPCITTPKPIPAQPASPKTVRRAEGPGMGAAMRPIAAAMNRSKREIPHYYLADEITLDTALAWLTEQNAGRPITERLLPAVLQLKAVALATLKFSEFNGFWRGDPAGGHFEPAGGNPCRRGLSRCAAAGWWPRPSTTSPKPLSELMEANWWRARAGSLRSSEMSDPTITVTNLGEKGVDSGLRGDLSGPGQHRRLRTARPSGWSWSTAGSGWPPRCRPAWPPTTAPATAPVVPCSSPRSTDCCSSRRICRSRKRRRP